MDAELIVREADEGDIGPIFELSNQPSVRDASFNSAPIAWAEHLEWFRRVRANPQCGFFVAVIEGLIAGQVRFTVEGAQATVSISTDPRFHGKGTGVALYRQGLDEFRKTHCVREVVARIKRRNQRSVAFFMKLGFVLSSTELLNGEEVVMMLHRLNGLEVNQ